MELMIENDGYEIKAVRKDIGTFAVVVIEWKHPNWSYFSDAMIWINSLHLQKWLPMAISECSKKYRSLEGFLAVFPYFSPIFSEI